MACLGSVTMVVVTTGKWNWAAGGLSVLVMIVAAVSPNQMVDADSALILIAAQAALERGSLDLSSYANDPGFRFDLESDYRIRRRNGGHYYYNLGSPILMLPVVWTARELGYDMRQADSDEAMQNMVSAVLCGVAFVFLFMLVRRIVPDGPALIIATVSFCGSSLMSTGATALWSQTITAPLMLMAVLLTVGCDSECGGRLSALRLGLALPILVAAFFCRPTTAFLALGIVAWLVLRLLRERRLRFEPGESDGVDSRRWTDWFIGTRAHLWRTIACAVVVFILGVVLIAGLLKFLPPYYHPERLTMPQISPVFGMYAVLLSPSRGLLVFSPFLVVVAAALVWARRDLECRPLLVLAAVWSATHLAAISIRAVWYGGHSFGPRLTAEVVLAAAIPTALAWKALRRAPRRSASLVLGVGYVVLGVIAVVLHGGQGLFNPAVQRWNYTPDVDTHQHLLMSWRYPQFLATSGQIEDRTLSLQMARLEDYSWGEKIGVGSPTAVLRDWHHPEGDRVWTRDQISDVLLRLPSDAASDDYRLEIRASGLGVQHVRIEINGAAAGELLIGHPASNHILRIPASLLRFNAINTIELHTPDARRPPSEDPRVLGVYLDWMRMAPESPIAPSRSAQQADDHS